MNLDFAADKLPILAPPHVQERIATLGRTEDIKFSPANRRLAIARFNDNSVVIFAISVSPTRVEVTGAIEIASPLLQGPHGLAFLDEHHILIANRYGKTCLFEVPDGVQGRCELSPVATLPGDGGPGAIAISRYPSHTQAFICNNFSNDVTRYVFPGNSNQPDDASVVVLKKWLDIPDGICVTNNSNWIAVSNHNTHSVLLFRNRENLPGGRNPAGLLRDLSYPHGLTFTADGRFILVADAGAPHVVVYESKTSGWAGVHRPALSVRVLVDEEFWRHRANRQEGGPKGVDIDSSMRVLATTCEAQPMAFFDLHRILQQATEASPFRSMRQTEAAVTLELHWGRTRAATVALARSARNAVRDMIGR